MTSLMFPRVYLAGPDVFRPDAVNHFQTLADACEEFGMEALAPFDAALASATPRQIFEENMRMLRRADGMIANLAPFRGAEPDAGTVFEVGAAHALGIPVVAYGMGAGSYSDRVRALYGAILDEKGILRDSAGHLIEDWGFPMNLMLACAVPIEDGPAGALRKLRKLLQTEN
ncbi:nucleoside 2-deoxyribosyltransferase [Variovorax sp. J22G73]|uniref:nucleoside 2-deoxyribosyltransferase n=1 Tax=unclassified Variovorax TaxID=663243 RepID=UPI002576AB22|nr:MULTISPECIES: nucleoside 2-deoxyribosyltransferase [unclassified Variovorax]MDM0010590.1 nucleoside 2-deoxyribosyltransferase [Variovorax sp. J22R203]MDM0103081.1 nucleoside 2-deoxyribosyltransferase [Variovorax sp. J22G73]